MPVLVVHRKQALFPTVEVARKIATDAPKARLVLMEGSAALPFLGDTDSVLTAIGEFLSEPDELRPAGLTERELEILAMLVSGTSTSGIANAFSISARTVDRHIANVYRKIGAHNRAEVIAYAYQHGLAPVA
jgi:DNA-binding NarL/FixJ family response regulator